MKRQKKGGAKVSVIVLTFNSVSKLGGFFNRVLTGLSNIKYDNVDIVFVDNNSQDNTVDYLKQYIQRIGFTDNVKILRLGKNYGWAGGNNRGALMCKDSDYLMFLNDDAVLEPGALNELVNSLETDTSIGAAQPLIVNLDGTYICGFDLGLGGFACPKIYNSTDGHQEIMEVFFTMGSALITRTNLFFKLGMFDEDYFYWYDDVDYCWRVRLAGFKVACIPSAVVHHYGSATLGKDNPKLYYYWVRNNLWTCTKNYDWRNLILTTPIRVGEMLIGGLGHNLLLKNALGAKSAIKGFLDGIIGLSTSLHKRLYVKSIREVDDAKVIKFMNPRVDVELLIGWLLRRLRKRKRIRT
ncbi:MAG: glycosyltransferase family 2 protein [Nitrososphaerota archaeon]